MNEEKIIKQLITNLKVSRYYALMLNNEEELISSLENALDHLKHKYQIF